MKPKAMVEVFWFIVMLEDRGGKFRRFNRLTLLVLLKFPFKITDTIFFCFLCFSIIFFFQKFAFCRSFQFETLTY